jgi:CBS domain-containing protein
MNETFVQATTTDTIQSVAKKLSETPHTAAIITEDNNLTGIITMHDFVNRVITKGQSLAQPVHTVMTPNPITIERTAYFYEAITTMLLHGIKHLPVTDSEKTNPVGIVTLTELLQIKSANFLKGTTKISTATYDTLPTIKTALYSTLGTMLQQEVPTLHTLDVMNTLYDQLIQRCVELAIEEMPASPPIRFCFYLMGSAGRREQFLLTDQDHFLVYENDRNKEYFQKLSEKIVANLELAGYKRCKGDMMASNPQWSGSLEQWNNRLREWVLHATNDRLLLAQNFFSYRFIYGDQSLHKQFTANIEQSLDRAKIFLYRLSQLERENPIPALEQPIRSIFRMQKKTIDLKKHILFPYHHSLQILALMNGITYGTPIGKIDLLHEKRILSNSFQKDLKASIESVLDYYVKNRWNQHQKGEHLTSTLDLTKLTTREKEELMLSIRLIKELQSHMLSYY